MRDESTWRWRAVALFVSCLVSSAGAQLTVVPHEPSGLYASGEPVQWTIQSDASAAADYTYTLLRNGITTIKQGSVAFVDGRATLGETLNEPGALLLEVRRAAPASRPARNRNGETRILSGALVNREAIRPTLSRPADFDEWWHKKIEQLQAIPVNPVIEKGDAARAGVDYFKIKFDTIEGKAIQGQLARPTREGKYPALLVLQWAGVYPLKKAWVVDRASQGWLALNIEPHDIEIDREPDYYRKLADGPLKDYHHQGDNNREKSYFLRMYLSAWRTTDYLASRNDWDGKTLVVMGTSMGGQQSLATAGLQDKVTAMLVLVPSGCDAGGPTNAVPRAEGFPDWAGQAAQKSDPAIIETGRYFDPANFASRIRCPALVSMGLYDETSPPVGVYAAFNQMRGKKEALPLYSGHQDQGGSQRPYNVRAQQWLDALAKGAQVPPN